MTGILDRIRTTTVGDLDALSGDFSDLPAATYRPRVPREMIRDVKGATDLKDAMPVSMPSGMNGLVRTDGTGRVDTRPFQDEVGLPSERQREFINSLVADLKDLDHDIWTQAVAYTDGMTAHKKWDRSRGGNVSVWIDHLKAKLSALRAEATVKKTYGDDSAWADLPNGYYAVFVSGAVHFFRVSRFRDGGVKLQERASDTLHPVRRGARRTAVLKAIMNEGPTAAAILYGQTIGACGRCGRTLTDAESRARGIGPDCWGKM